MASQALSLSGKIEYQPIIPNGDLAKTKVAEILTQVFSITPVPSSLRSVSREKFKETFETYSYLIPSLDQKLRIINDKLTHISNLRNKLNEIKTVRLNDSLRAATEVDEQLKVIQAVVNEGDITYLEDFLKDHFETARNDLVHSLTDQLNDVFEEIRRLVKGFHGDEALFCRLIFSDRSKISEIITSRGEEFDSANLDELKKELEVVLSPSLHDVLVNALRTLELNEGIKQVIGLVSDSNLLELCTTRIVEEGLSPYGFIVTRLLALLDDKISFEIERMTLLNLIMQARAQDREILNNCCDQILKSARMTLQIISSNVDERVERMLSEYLSFTVDHVVRFLKGEEDNCTISFLRRSAIVEQKSQIAHQEQAPRRSGASRTKCVTTNQTGRSRVRKNSESREHNITHQIEAVKTLFLEVKQSLICAQLGITLSENDEQHLISFFSKFLDQLKNYDHLYGQFVEDRITRIKLLNHLIAKHLAGSLTESYVLVLSKALVDEYVKSPNKENLIRILERAIQFSQNEVITG
ncbi:MAG: hypothetical protein NZT61_05355 [Deltaproteobacteria bacterium]|nr:hypothetical protein [Deltaproteobacteria bacterium]